MPKIGWVTEGIYPQGGRQITIKHFRDSAPEDFEIVDIDLNKPEECDVYVVHSASVPKNLPLFPKSLKPGTSKIRKVITYAHQWDIWPFGSSTVIYQSPLHATKHQFGKKIIIPPPLLDSDYNLPDEAEKIDKQVWFGTASKEEGFDVAIRIAETTKIPTDFYGLGIPTGNDTAVCNFKGYVEKSLIPGILHSYKKMIYFPRDPRPFDRMLAEALAAGMDIEVSGKLGIESFEKPISEVLEDCKQSCNEFWKVVADHI